MDRRELRFRILFEYYNELHNGGTNESNANKRVTEMNVADSEKNAAMIWLHDLMFIDGEIFGSLGSLTSKVHIKRISGLGINYVEQIMDTALSENPEFSQVKELPKTDRIAEFAKKCLSHPATDQICKKTFEAIINHMQNGS